LYSYRVISMSKGKNYLNANGIGRVI
jgi:hypothetical protein